MKLKDLIFPSSVPPKDYEQMSEEEKDKWLDDMGRYYEIRRWIRNGSIILSLILSILSLIISLR